MHVDSQANRRVGGVVLLRNGRLPTILVASGPPQASYGDSDGTVGVTRLIIGLHNCQTGKHFVAEVLAIGVDIIDRGLVAIRIPGLGPGVGNLVTFATHRVYLAFTTLLCGAAATTIQSSKGNACSRYSQRH